ncbi:tetratricopeptide repeat protein [Catenovulum sediminis]|uniref:Tetratricopeptide repeat protein n=1 Tax=Catenovulum sediminis TaxID=1740262 RepID=A0ABV1RLR4_9ALTE|nr:hypothetical protein [Catenovulum sediminis]
MKRIKQGVLSRIIVSCCISLLCLTTVGCISTESGRSRAVNDIENNRLQNGNNLAAWINSTDDNSKIQQDKLAQQQAAERALKQAQRKQKLTELYQLILASEPNQSIKTDIQYRITELNTQIFEQQNQAENVTADLLIIQYQKLLEEYPNRAENEHILYQLAKAYAIKGEALKSLTTIERLLTEYPNSQYYNELHFRRGDIYYNHNNYPAALTAFQQVLNKDKNNLQLAPEKSVFYRNSLYMAAWASLKAYQYASADQYFVTLMAQTYQTKTNLYQDAQRGLNISLSQQQQAASLNQLVKYCQQQRIDIRQFKHNLYAGFADFMLQKDLKRDAEQTYLAYIKQDANSIWSARFYQKLMDLYQQQGLLAKKRDVELKFSQQYSLTSAFWQSAQLAEKQEVLAHLLTYSQRFARQYYAIAQDMEEFSLDSEAPNAKRINTFATAAEWFSRYLQQLNTEAAQTQTQTQTQTQQEQTLKNKSDIFNPSAEALEKTRLLYAEALYGAYQYENALNAYLVLVAEYNQQPDYLFTALLTIRELIAQHNTQGENAQQSVKFLAKLRTQRRQLDKLFVTRFTADKRALAIAHQAAQYAANEKLTEEMLFFTDKILQQLEHTTQTHKLSNIEKIYLRSAYLHQANMYYAQAQYTDAETAYLNALQYIKKGSKQYQEISDLIAASIYFYAKSLETTQPLLAATHYLRLGQVVTASKYQINAEFDAANLLIEAQKWQQASEVLVKFKQVYPAHEYSASVPAKLANIYRQQQKWSLAAAQLIQMAKTEKDYELAREAQYTAAEYYLKDDNLKQAILAFRTYAHQYPKPFSLAQEVRFKMSEFYLQTKEPNKRYFWLRKILSEHKKQSRLKRTATNAHPFNQTEVEDRSRYLASYSAYELGLAHHRTFSWRKLKIPLQQSMRAKQKAMQQAIQYYQACLDFELAEFVPKSTFQLAELYRQLALAVMQSERPAELDELALEEYELILEEIAFPFEEKAIDIHSINAQRSHQNLYDEWIKLSFAKLAQLVPAEYQRQEVTIDVYENML